MKKDSPSLDRPTLRGLLRRLSKDCLTHLKSVLEYEIIRLKEETVSLAQDPNMVSQKIRLAAGETHGVERLLQVVKGVIDERTR